MRIKLKAGNMNIVLGEKGLAVNDGAKIVGVTTTPPAAPKGNQGDDRGVVPANPPPTVQDKGGLSETTKKADAENPVNSWVCLASALGDLPLSYPART